MLVQATTVVFTGLRPLARSASTLGLAVTSGNGSITKASSTARRYGRTTTARFSSSSSSGGAGGRMPPPGASSSNVLGIFVFGSICCATLGLGVWQTKRYFWKVDLIESLKKTLAAEAINLPAYLDQVQLHEMLTIQDDAAAMEKLGRRVVLNGEFVHTGEKLLGPRSAPIWVSGGNAAQGMATNPQGYYVITPMIRDDGTVLYVNRGWAPMRALSNKNNNNSSIEKGGKEQTEGGGRERHVSSISRPTGNVAITAIIGREEKAGSFTPKNDPGTGKLFWLEFDAVRDGDLEMGVSLGTPVDAYTRGAAKGGSSSASKAGMQLRPLGKMPMVYLEQVADNQVDDYQKSVGHQQQQQQLRASSSKGVAASVYPMPKDMKYVGEQEIGGVSPITHATYALTWYSLAGAGALMTFYKFRRPPTFRTRPRSTPAAPTASTTTTATNNPIAGGGSAVGSDSAKDGLQQKK